MLTSQLFLLLAIFLLCIFLAYEDIRSAFVFLLLVSPLLHKEVFSLVRWDILPIRLVVAAISVTCAVKFLLWIRKKRDWPEIFKQLKDPMLILLVLTFVERVISLANSKNLQASMLVLIFFGTMVFLYILISYLSQRYTEKFILSVIKFYVLIGFGTAAIALLQFILDMKYGIVFGAIWRIPGKWSRVGSVFWDVNHYAGYISALILIAVGLFVNSKSRISKAFYGFSVVFMTLILALTNSRSAWIGFGVSLIILFLNAFVSKYSAKKLILVGLLVLALLIPAFASYQDKDSAFREKIRSYFQYRGDSFASHIMLLEGSFEVFTKYPILGGGYGSFFEHFKDTQVAATFYARDPAALSVRVPAHSVWGEVLSETGLVGFITFVVLVLLLTGTVFLAAHKEPEWSKKFLLFSLGSSICGFLTSGIFYSYNAEFFWIILFLAFVYGKTLLGEAYSLSNVFSFHMRNSVFPLFIISVFASLLIFVQLDSNHLIPWDEAIYAKVAKNMVQKNDYLSLYWETDKHWFEKPPLYMWMSSQSMKIFGFGSLGAKLPSAILGFLTIIAAYFLGKKMFNTYVGILSAFILLTTTQFLFYSRMAMLDVSLTFFLSAALLFYYLAVKNKSLKFWALCGMFGGLAVMTKGVAGLLILPLIGASEIYFALTEKKLSVIISKSSLAKYGVFALAFALIALPWHLYSYLEYKKEFVDMYLEYHVFKRATESVEGKGAPFFWYLTVMRTSMRIWFIGLLMALGAFVVAAILKITKKSLIGLEQLQNSNAALLLVWGIVIFLFFSSSVSKLIWYIMPIYPVAAVFVAYHILAGYEWLAARLRFGGSFYKSMFVVLVAVCGLMYLLANRSLVYVGDSTGQVAELMIKKDRVIGVDETLYYDRIEKPLPLFYTDGPIEAVDYRPLIKILNGANYDESVTYITKPSRYEKLAVLYPNTVLIDRKTDFVLVRVRSDKEVVLTKILQIEADIAWITKESASGNPEALARVKDLPELRQDLFLLRQEDELRSSAN